MNDLIQGIQSSIAYIEENLSRELDVSAIAKQAHISTFYFQRIFAVLSGVSVGEYIRNRRLTLAAQELASTDGKVIDIAAKYGYESPDSFNRAFQRFHGISPSAAKKSGASLRSYAPLKIKLTLEGGTMLEYKIVEKQQFTVMGVSRKFNTEISYQRIPEFWSEVMAAEKRPVCGMYGVCLDSGDNGDYEYLIADNYIPWEEVPDGCITRVIPAGTWAVFPCRGALPTALQDVNTRIWFEWVPGSKSYRLAGNYNIEMYAPPAEKPEDNYSEIWVPVEKIG